MREFLTAFQTMFDRFLWSSNTLTRVAPHIRDANNVQRMWNYLVFASIPALLLGLCSLGHQMCSLQATEAALAEGIAPERILLDALVPAMDEVGNRYECGEFFVPEMMIAARTMQTGLDVIKPLLEAQGSQKETVGTVVIGTVFGDLHDIGKNLVAMMMEGAGFEVIDLGINIEAETYIGAIREHRPNILGMSALLTTTMPYMKVVIDEMVACGVRDDCIVLVGGAPLNEEFGQAIGADAYCRDAATAVETAKRLVGGAR